MKVNIEDVKAYLDWKTGVNDCELKNIEWYKDGQKISIPDDTISEWSFMGLTNIDFAKWRIDCDFQESNRSPTQN